jgi:hypothetical protein
VVPTRRRDHHQRGPAPNSASQANAVTVVDYATATEVARVPVGVFPQRERIGEVGPAVLSALSPAAG